MPSPTACWTGTNARPQHVWVANVCALMCPTVSGALIFETTRKSVLLAVVSLESWRVSRLFSCALGCGLLY